jgi:WD40 repeat protein
LSENIVQNGGSHTLCHACASPDGDMVAAASHNGSVYLYRVSRDGFSYKKEAKLTGPGGQQLTHLDWDETGDYLTTCSADYSQAGGGSISMDIFKK